MRWWRFAAALWFLLVLAACSSAPTPQASAALRPVILGTGERLRAVATTNIVADIVRQVGGDLVDLQTLLPTGVDPHAFEPTPQDVAAAADANVVFANGAGLEEFMAKLLGSAANATPVIYVSDGVAPRELSADHLHADEEESGDEHGHEHDEHSGQDPHTWTSPANAMIFVRNIRTALQSLDPANASTYDTNSAAYLSELEQVDAWIREQIDTIPLERRKLVTDHLVFGYYADRYGLEQVGALVPGFSTGAAASAKEMAALEDTVRSLGVRAVFVGTSVNPAQAERVAADLGIKLATLYTGSLGQVGSGAETYLGYLRFNTEAIVAALR